MSQENVEVVKAFFDAYNARNSEAVDRLLHSETEITTLSARAGLGNHWSQETTKRYFEQLDEAWTDFRIEVEDYRDLGERVVALGVQRAAGMSSQIEVPAISRSCSSSGTRKSCCSTATTIGRPPSKPPGCAS